MPAIFAAPVKVTDQNRHRPLGRARTIPYLPIYQWPVKITRDAASDDEGRCHDVSEKSLLTDKAPKCAMARDIEVHLFASRPITNHFS